MRGGAALAAIVLVLVLAGCGSRPPADEGAGHVKVGIVFDIGGKDDRSFNAAAWNGVRCAETGQWADGRSCGKPALGVLLRDVEPGTPVNIEPAIRAFAERGYDLIIGIGFAQAPGHRRRREGLSRDPFRRRGRRQPPCRTWPRWSSRSRKGRIWSA